MAPRQSLETAIRLLGAPARLPPPLPLAHSSIARWLASIVKGQALVPWACPVFNKKLVYLFYGGNYYRPSPPHPTRNAAEMPVVFVFAPSILPAASTLYPFDTGAMHAGKFGAAGTALMPFKRRFAVRVRGRYQTATMLVAHLFGTNEAYLKGHPSDPGGKPAPIPDLAAFLSADLTSLGIDMRQASIECQYASEIRLDERLLWVGLPEAHMPLFGELCAALEPYVPAYYAYESHTIFNPGEIGRLLDDRARDAVIRRYLRAF